VISPRLRDGVIVLVCVVWATNFLAGLFIDDYESSEAINAIFMGIVGGLFALGARKSGDDDKDGS